MWNEEKASKRWMNLAWNLWEILVYTGMKWSKWMKCLNEILVKEVRHEIISAEHTCSVSTAYSVDAIVRFAIPLVSARGSRCSALHFMHPFKRKSYANIEGHYFPLFFYLKISNKIDLKHDVEKKATCIVHMLFFYRLHFGHLQQDHCEAEKQLQAVH